MSIYRQMRMRHRQEIKDLLASCSGMTIPQASTYLGIDAPSLRRMAFDYQVEFQAVYGGKKTAVKVSNKLNNSENVSLPAEPWK